MLEGATVAANRELSEKPFKKHGYWKSNIAKKQIY